MSGAFCDEGDLVACRALAAELRLQRLSLARAVQKATRRSEGCIKAPSAPKFEAMADWQELAREAGVQLPKPATSFTTGRMERWLRKLGISVKAYYLWNGAGLDGTDSSARLSDFITRNPTWSFRAWAGLVLQHRELIETLWRESTDGRQP